MKKSVIIIKVISALLLVYSLFYLLSGLQELFSGFGLPFNVFNIFAQFPPGIQTILSSIFGLIIGLFYVYVALSLWRLKEWARIVEIVLMGFPWGRAAILLS